MRLLVVEDNKTNLMVLTGILRNLAGCEVVACLDPKDAMARAESEIFDLVLVDYLMPGIDGREFIVRLRQQAEYAHIPMVMITADGQRQTRIDGITAGANDFLTKPVDPVELKARVGNLLTLRQQQRDLASRASWLSREVAKATAHLVEREEEIIWRLSRALAYRDDDTGDHTFRVASVAQMIAKEMGFDRDICRTLYLAAPLHDIGKVAIPDAVLLKPGPLTEPEIAVMRTHVPIGQDILSDGTSDLVRMAWRIAGAHHERWDGAGYPHGLGGEAIPIEGRIAAVADVFDALCSNRPYKAAWTAQRARQEIQKNAGSQFDPACVAAFERHWPVIATLYGTPLEGAVLSLTA